MLMIFDYETYLLLECWLIWTWRNWDLDDL